jgi:hypothetical protein
MTGLPTTPVADSGERSTKRPAAARAGEAGTARDTTPVRSAADRLTASEMRFLVTLGTT